jgi:hypothetical protein
MNLLPPSSGWKIKPYVQKWFGFAVWKIIVGKLVSASKDGCF